MTSRSTVRGFTIVELLIVIVIIAILAAITIVAYNGIQNRAKTSSAQAAANTAIKKLEAYNADTPSGGYPAYSSLLTGAGSTTTYQLTGVTFSDAATDPSTGTVVAATAPNQLLFYSCTTGGGVKYWDYTSSATNKWTADEAGGAPSGLSGCTYKRASATS